MSKQLAENICKVHGKDLVDENGGATISGVTLSELYSKKWSSTGYNVREEAESIRHWVLAAGYDRKGEFKYIISKYILNV